MPTPSLLIVPSRWKTGNPGKLYSQIPTNGNGDFNVTGVVTGGTSIGTRVNNLGYIEPITTSGTPRLDYYTSSGTPGCPALLVEPSAQNICLQSQALDVTPTWLAQNSATVNPNTAISPDGTQNADTINLAPVNDSRVRQTIMVANSTTYTISCFYKNIALTTGQTFRMRFNNALPPPNEFIATATIDLAAGTAIFAIGGTAGTGFSGTATGRVENYGNGWYRVSMTFTVGTNGGNAGLFEPGNVDPGAVRSFYAWGAQVETGSVATSYIPTTTGTVTRAAEVISVSGAVSGSIGQQSGTVYCEFQFNRTAQGNNGIFCVESTNNQNRIFFGNTSPTTCSVQLLANNSSIFSTSVGTLTDGQYYKIAVGYSSGNTKVYLNGNPVITNTSGYTMAAALSRICLGNYETNPGLVTISRIRSLALYAERLTDADLMLLTMPGNNTYLPQAVWDNYLSRAGNTEVPDCLYTRHADLLDV